MTDVHHAARAYWLRKEGNQIMKYLAIIALTVVALSFGACAKKDTGYSGSTTTSHSSSTGYSK